MESATEYLTAQVLDEREIISYRLLSRALKVHSNQAKRLLYQFYSKANQETPGSVHATYLISGRQRRRPVSQTNGVHSQGDEDVTMQSSPFPSSSAPQPASQDEDSIPSSRVMLLVREENLDEAKRQFDEITAVHVYSLEPGPLKDLYVLADCNGRVSSKYASEDPITAWKQYGTIQNPRVQRRAPRTGPPVVKKEAPSVKPASVLSKPTSAATTTSKTTKEPTAPKAAPVKEESTSAASSQSNSADKGSKLKRETSDLFKSFAKAKPKAEKKAAAEEDAAMALSDEDGDEDLMAVDAAGDTETNEAAKSRKDRQAELQKMMEMEDEPMEDAAETSEAVDSVVVAKEETPAAAPQEQQETVTVSNGRRRGRRRVMQKKTVQDEEGYLVTKEEAGWESFSEEEPAPKKAKMAPVSTAPPAAAKAKKGGKPGQRNLMSFFGKKA